MGVVSARDALINTLTDTLKAYKSELAPGTVSANQLMAPETMKLLPLYLLGIFKHVCILAYKPATHPHQPAFRADSMYSLDERAYATVLLKTLPTWYGT